MGFFDRFKKNKENDFDPLHDLQLADLKVGYMVDYDLNTYKVTGYNTYDFGDGYTVEEWELTGADDKLYLELYDDDGQEWSVSRKLNINAIDGNIKKHIMENDDPPEQITYKGKTYYLDESVAGFMYEGGGTSKQEMIAWTFVDEQEENFITIEQWGEEDFDASLGLYVEEYQFTNILPSATQ